MPRGWGNGSDDGTDDDSQGDTTGIATGWINVDQVKEGADRTGLEYR